MYIYLYKYNNIYNIYKYRININKQERRREEKTQGE